MGQGVEAARNHLFFRHAVGVQGIQQGELRVQRRIIAPGFDLHRFVGDDSAAVHLAAGAGNGHDDAQWKRFNSYSARLHPEIVPDVPVVYSRQGNRLAAVHDRTAADGKNQVDIFFAGQFCAFQHLAVGRVGHDAGKFRNGLARRVQNSCDLFINSVAFDGAAAVSQHHISAVLFQYVRQVLTDTAFTEIRFRRIFKNKVFHNPLFLSLSHSLTGFACRSVSLRKTFLCFAKPLALHYVNAQKLNAFLVFIVKANHKKVQCQLRNVL